METTTKPIEVLLSRPHLEVTCRIVCSDGTAIAVGVDALSLRAAQREMTAWLFDRGYEPAGRWSTQCEHDRRAARTFRRQDPDPAEAAGPAEPTAPAEAAGPAEPTEPAADVGPAGADPATDPVPARNSGPSGEPVPARDSGPAAAPAPAPRPRRPAPARSAERGRTSSPQAAETELRAWAAGNAERDNTVRVANAAGVSVQRIQEITGIARTTIMRILGTPPRPAPRRPSP